MEKTRKEEKQHKMMRQNSSLFNSISTKVIDVDVICKEAFKRCRPCKPCTIHN